MRCRHLTGKLMGGLIPLQPRLPPFPDPGAPVIYTVVADVGGYT
jgi:hypothetical protein